MATQGAVKIPRAEEEILRGSTAPDAGPSEVPAALHDQHFRSHVGHISRHSGVFFLGTIFSAALGYVFKVYLARVLGAEALGLYALGITLVGFFELFNPLGLVEAAVRYSAVYRATGNAEQLRSLLWRGGALMFACSALLAAALYAIGPSLARHFYHSEALAGFVPWFSMLLFLGAMSTFYGRILAGYKSVGRRTIITNFIGLPATMILSIALLVFGWGLRGYLLAQTISAGLVIALLLIMVWRLTPEKARFFYPWPSALPKDLWSFSFAAAGVLMLEFLMSQVDKIALGFYKGAREVGIYAVAAAMVAYIPVILNSVNQVFSPFIADLHARGELALLGRLYKALTKWVFGITLPLAITVMVYAHPIMRIFGHEFEKGWPVLILGAAGQLVNCGVGSVTLLLLMSGNQRTLLMTQAIMSAVIIAVSFVFVPIWGLIGAAAAAALTTVGTNLWNLLSVRRILGLWPISGSFVRLAGPTAASLAAALLLRYEAPALIASDWMNLIIAVVAAYGCFAAAACFGLDSDDHLVLDALRSRIWRARPVAQGAAL